MTASSLAAISLPRALRGSAIALAAGLAVLGLAFHEEIAAAVRVWSNSTAYNHCFLVLPIALYLAWDRRAMLAGVAIRPIPWFGLAALPLSLGWLVADLLGIMEGRQLVLMCLVQVLFLSVLGWRMYGRLAAPLLYLFFLVPFGEFLVPALQSFTARFIDFGLSLTSLPYFIDNYVIEIPEGTFYVAEACAGLRFLIASVAFGVLYAILIYRSWGRRAIFVGVSIVVPIIANGFRALGIVWLGHVLGSAQAAAADHIIYGWIFFSIVILLLVVLGLPFREDTRPPAPVRSERDVFAGVSFGAWTRAVATLAACALAGPAAAAALANAVGGLTVILPDATFAGCVSDSVAGPSPSAPAGTAVRAYYCNDGAIRLAIAAFPPRTGASAIIAEQRRMIGQTAGAEIEVSALSVPGSNVHWRLAQSREPPRSAAAYAIWIDGEPTVGGLRARFHQAINALAGSDTAPVVVAAVFDFGRIGPDKRFDTIPDRLRSFLASQTGLAGEISQLSTDAVRPR